MDEIIIYSAYAEYFARNDIMVFANENSAGDVRKRNVAKQKLNLPVHALILPGVSSETRLLGRDMKFWREGSSIESKSILLLSLSRLLASSLPSAKLSLISAYAGVIAVERASTGTVASVLENARGAPRCVERGARIRSAESKDTLAMPRIPYQIFVTHIGPSFSTVLHSLLLSPFPSRIVHHVALCLTIRACVSFVPRRVTYGPRVIYHTAAAADRERDVRCIQQGSAAHCAA